MKWDSIKSLIISHKATFSLFAIVLVIAFFNFFSSTTFVHKIPTGEGRPMEGQTIYGCKMCTGLLPFFSGGGCSINISNCFIKFIISFLGYIFIAIIVGIIIDWILGKIKFKKNKIV